jgi:hypothetical protein
MSASITKLPANDVYVGSVKVIDSTGAIGGTSGGMLTGVTSGTTLIAQKFAPTASATTASINYHKLFAIGDITGTTAYGFGDPAKPTTGIMGSFGRTAVATGTQTDTGLDIRVINKVTNTGVNAIQGAYIKAKNYSTGTVGSMIGLFVEVAAEGTVTNGATAIKIGCDGTTLKQDIMFSNGLGFFTSTEAITANSTLTSLPAGSIGITSNGTGVGHLFVSDGTKWQYAAVA